MQRTKTRSKAKSLYWGFGGEIGSVSVTLRRRGRIYLSSYRGERPEGKGEGEGGEEASRVPAGGMGVERRRVHYVHVDIY